MDIAYNKLVEIVNSVSVEKQKVILAMVDMANIDLEIICHDVHNIEFIVGNDSMNIVQVSEKYDLDIYGLNDRLENILQLEYALFEAESAFGEL